MIDFKVLLKDYLENKILIIVRNFQPSSGKVFRHVYNYLPRRRFKLGLGDATPIYVPKAFALTSVI